MRSVYRFHLLLFSENAEAAASPPDTPAGQALILCGKRVSLPLKTEN